jgi:basic membrane protein A and related proteins
MQLRRRTLLGTLAVAGLARAPRASQPLRVAFVYNSPTGDAGWTFQHDKGRRAVEAALGPQVQTAFVESVTEQDAERVIRAYAQAGHELIFATSFGFMNPMLKVAGEFPETAFEHATGYKTAPNMGVYHARDYEARYLTGLVAGTMSRTGTAGFIASFPIPEVVRSINAFTLGMRGVRPDAQVKVLWASTWFDPGKEREAAEALVIQGCDVVN